MPSRILIVEDHEPFCRFLWETLKQRPEFELVGQASDGLEAVCKAEELQPDLILLDIGLPKLSGIEAAARIRKVAPQSKILAFSQESSPDVVQAVLNSGALGYVYKSRTQNDLLPAIGAVLQGLSFVSKGLEGHSKGDQPSA